MTADRRERQRLAWEKYNVKRREARQALAATKREERDALIAAKREARQAEIVAKQAHTAEIEARGAAYRATHRDPPKRKSKRARETIAYVAFETKVLAAWGLHR